MDLKTILASLPFVVLALAVCAVCLIQRATRAENWREPRGVVNHGQEYSLSDGNPDGAEPGAVNRYANVEITNDGRI